MYGIEVYQLWPQAGPFWRREPETGERELFADYDAAYLRTQELFSMDGLRNYSFRAVEYREDQA